MASPIVANRVAKVRSEHPELNAAEAIQYLLNNETQNLASLNGKVTGSRALKADEHPQSLMDVDHEALKILMDYYSGR